ncbi:hypothetical protein HDR58_09560 [bacterium]|nr:hypothetical protein [bacterium]
MFDWFREIGEELGGIDSVAAKKERMEKKEKERLNTFIFSGKMKLLIICLGILYIIMSGSTIKTLIAEGRIAIIIKRIVMMINAAIVIFALCFGKKKGEIVALIGAFIFVLLLFLSIILV